MSSLAVGQRRNLAETKEPIVGGDQGETEHLGGGG